ncbi:hypothetical protein [[Limnothrix rosea] IAM M-220]|uniref:hypothetical protein n=1 Tax=[Limnothrix rosea] IAM M-220 TaxID=454133 RepID=UPI0009621372|nr:hypothetical protein [[Limnothrix rosea] IAM M-220]OKH18587.1 hypothetical protein NIES208_05095 [[Limnothrix rosea] IAM M-220]
MGNWDFLLQKKGDRQWGTAHKSDLKLKAGNYRIAAKGDASVDVAVTVQFVSAAASADEPPKVQSRAKRTNAKGLLAIVPFTQFKPGQWTITCQSLDVDNPWEKTLSIYVKEAIAKPKTFRPLPLPPNPNLFSFDGSLNLNEKTSAAAVETEQSETEETVLDRSLAKLMATQNGDPAATENLKATVASTLQDLEESPAVEDAEPEDWRDTETAAGLLQGSLQELDDLLKAELEPIWQEMDKAAQERVPAPEAEPSKPDFLTIVLEQHVLTWQGDRPVVITGELQATKDIPEQYQPALRQVKLRFQLVNPQNAQQQVTVEQQLNDPQLPHGFRQIIAVDPQWQTLAIVGEIDVVTNEQPPQILATQSLHLVADYQAIAANIQLPEVPPEDESLLEESSDPRGIDLPEPETFIVAEKVVETGPNGSILPPKLHHQERTTPHTPELPTFMQTPAKAEEPPMGEAVLEDSANSENIASSVEIEPEIPALPGGDAPVVMQGRSPANDDHHGTATVDPDDIPYPFVLSPEETGTATTSEGQQPETVSPEVTANIEESEAEATTGVPDLDWNSRFFQRLNTMASEGENSAWLEEAQQHKDNDSVVIFQKDVMAMEPLVPEQQEEELPDTMEIVVDSLWDETEEVTTPTNPVEPSYDASGLPYPTEFVDKTTATDGAIQSSQPVPEPVLSLSKPEYRSEDMAVVRVTLPPYGDRLYVKLWLQDRQTRSILGGPYQLTDFTPNQDGDAETLMQVPIPQGAMEVRFEAIAINPRLQQESRKVGVDRHVIPRNFSEMNWDDLEV